jgi:transposase
MGPHQRLLLQSHLRHLDFLDAEIAGLDGEVATRMTPFESALSQADSVPGIGLRTAEAILAETGVEMSRFPTAAHLSSWARVCPGNNESGGKRRTTSTGRGNPWLRSALVEAAWAAARTRGTYLSAQYHRLAARRGAKRAIVALAHTILVILYHLLRTGKTYQDLGSNYFDERAHQQVLHRAVQRIERLGYRVSLEAA